MCMCFAYEGAWCPRSPKEDLLGSSGSGATDGWLDKQVHLLTAEPSFQTPLLSNTFKSGSLVFAWTHKS